MCVVGPPLELKAHPAFPRLHLHARRVLSETVQTFKHLLQSCGLPLLILCALDCRPDSLNTTRCRAPPPQSLVSLAAQRLCDGRSHADPNHEQL